MDIFDRLFFMWRTMTNQKKGDPSPKTGDPLSHFGLSGWALIGSRGPPGGPELETGPVGRSRVHPSILEPLNRSKIAVLGCFKAVLGCFQYKLDLNVRPSVRGHTARYADVHEKYCQNTPH